MPIRDNRDELLIDKNDLDREVCEQPSRSGAIGLEAARLASVRDQMKDHLKVITARRAIAIREAHAEDSRKPTEAQIDAWLMVDDDRREAMSSYLNAERDVADAEAKLAAWRERGFMLRTLADLYSASYWTSVSMNGPHRQVAEQEGNDARRAVAQERRRLRGDGSR